MNPRTDWKLVLDGAQMVTTHLVREPVREAVADALREKGVTAGGADPEPDQTESDGHGRSKLLLGLATLAAGGAIYYIRHSGESDGRRTASTEGRRSHGGASSRADERTEATLGTPDSESTTDDTETGESGNSTEHSPVDRTGERR